MGEKTTIIGTVTSIKKEQTQKKDLVQRTGKLILSSDFGKITIVGEESMVFGFAPDDKVTVTLEREQLTVTEAMNKAAEDKKKK